MAQEGSGPFRARWRTGRASFAAGGWPSNAVTGRVRVSSRYPLVPPGPGAHLMGRLSGGEQKTVQGGRAMARSVYWLGLGIAAVGLAFGLTSLCLGQRTRVSWANIQQIGPSMTRREVEALLGPSSRDPLPLWAKGVIQPGPAPRQEWPLTGPRGPRMKFPPPGQAGLVLVDGTVYEGDFRFPPVVWHSDGGVLFVGFDEKGRVCKTVAMRGPCRNNASGPLARLRAWLGW
jgi:hypothetical protein